jgi:hypothetical protein
VTSVDSAGDESAQSLGISPATLASSASGAAGAAGCFIESVSHSVSKQWIWLMVVLGIAVAIGCRRQAQGTRRTVSGNSFFV